MGTRADFYLGRDPETMEWLGSIGWDGYPDGIDEAVLFAGTAADYRAALVAFAESREDWTDPERGWPWPWNDSGTTDYAYAFDGGIVWASYFGQEWFDAREVEPDDDGGKAEFPDMSERKNVRRDHGSGLMTLTFTVRPEATS